MTFVIQFFVAMVATVSFSVIFNAPRKELVFCGITGAVGWIVYYLMYNNFTGPVAASLISTFLLTLFARLFSAKRKNPVTVYLLAGIFPLVPGAGIYYTAFYFFTGNKAMFTDAGTQTLEVAIAIVFGIIFGSAIPQTLFNKITGNPGTAKR